MKQGFTLIEMTMVLLIVGLLVGSFVIPLGAQMDINNIKATDQRLAQIKEALLGYAARNRRLPCPASNATTGIEDTTICNSERFLPWAVLGVDSKDAWGNYFIYRVDTAHTTPQDIPCTIAACVTCSLCTATCCIGNVVMCPTTLCSECANECSKCIRCGKTSPFYITFLPYDASIPQATDKLEVKNKLDTTTYVQNAIAIIYSYGKNKAANGSNATVDQIYTQDDFAPNDFDDRLVWLSENELVSRLTAAGFRIK